MDTQWLKSAQENFREAMNSREWEMAQAVLLDVAHRGFTSQSADMQKELDATAPSAPHGYILGFLRKKNEEYKAKGLVPTLDLLIEDLTG